MNLFKNPIFWGILLFAGGMVVGGIGWDKDESTLAERTPGSIAMIIIGGLMIISGAIIFFVTSRRK